MVTTHPNYHQLLYFWAVVREGGVVRAAHALHVTPQTVSGQLKLLEAEFRGRLVTRVGRGLEPTDLGRTVFRYAEEIFARGLELAELVRTGAPRTPLPLLVGVADGVADTTAARTLAPATAGSAAKIVCRSGPLESLLADLASHQLDLVLSPSALPSSSALRGASHLLAESDVAVFATPGVVRRLKGRFPACLHGAPWLLPAVGTAVRRALDGWFGRQGIAPTIVGEFDSSTLMKACGARGAGLFCASAEIEAETIRTYGVAVVGRTREVRARVYAITAERRIPHPAVTALIGPGGATTPDAG